MGWVGAWSRRGGGGEPTVAQGVSGAVSWASKPITGAALIEAALEGLICTSSPLIHWSDGGSASTTKTRAGGGAFARVAAGLKTQKQDLNSTGVLFHPDASMLLRRPGRQDQPPPSGPRQLLSARRGGPRWLPGAVAVFNQHFHNPP